MTTRTVCVIATWAALIGCAASLVGLVTCLSVGDPDGVVAYTHAVVATLLAATAGHVVLVLSDPKTWRQ